MTKITRRMTQAGLALALTAIPMTLSARSAPHEAASAASATSDATRQIEAALDRISEGYRTSNAKLASAPYVHDDSYVLFDVMPPFTDSGWSTLFKKNADFFKATDGPTKLYWTDKHIEVDQHLAYFRGIAHFDATYKDGRPMKGEFRHTLIFRKFGSTWLIIHEHASMPNPAIAMVKPAS